jgi:glucose-6-phosphate isomerase
MGAALTTACTAGLMLAEWRGSQAGKWATKPLAALKDFAEKIHTGQVKPLSGGHFQRLLLIGIGGSALGPQLVTEAIGHGARMPIHFFDNTDPAGIDRVLSDCGGNVSQAARKLGLHRRSLQRKLGKRPVPR